MIGTLKKTFRDLPYQATCALKKTDPLNNFLIFSDPRSGSTWLSETLKTIPKTLLIDEPLHIASSKELERLNFGWRQHIPEGSNWPEAKNYFESIFSAQILNRDLCYQNKLMDLMSFEKLVVKIIRGKMLLPWLCEQFEFKYKPIVLVRHPFAMVSSMMKHSGWNYEFSKFEIPDSPHVGFYEKHASFLSSLNSKEEQLVALWCMGNNHTLKNSNNDSKWISFNYESFVSNPTESLAQIFKSWKIAIPKGIEKSVQRPSSSTFDKDKINAMDQIHNWRDNFSKELLFKMTQVLEYFEVDYYGIDPLPSIPASKAHL